MRHSFPLPDAWDSETIWPHLAAYAADGLTGWSLDADSIHAEFPEREELTEEEEATVAAHVAAYVHIPTWTAVRAERIPLLSEADHRINAALDQGEDATPLRAYRQALRDVTEQDDPLNVTWPAKPWEA